MSLLLKTARGLSIGLSSSNLVSLMFPSMIFWETLTGATGTLGLGIPRFAAAAAMAILTLMRLILLLTKLCLIRSTTFAQARSQVPLAELSDSFILNR